MHPILLILATFLFMLGFVAFGMLGWTMWERGTRTMAIIGYGLAIACLLAADACTDALGRAYLAREQGSGG